MAKAACPDPARTVAMLQVLATHRERGVRPAQFAYLLLETGVLTRRAPRPWRAQGAGRIGGGILAQLARDGLVYGSGLYGLDYRPTAAGIRQLAAAASATAEGRA